jgi:hypothetical protein
MTVDFDGDGRRELYIGTEAYARKFWRIERGRTGVVAAERARADGRGGLGPGGRGGGDFEGDGRPELVVAAGPWRAYDVRVYKPTAPGSSTRWRGGAFGSFEAEAR